MKLRSLARPYLSCQINSGSNALFWHDDWTGLGPLLDNTGANGPRVSGIRSMAVVADAISNGVWALPAGRHPILVLLRGCLPISVPDVNSTISDFYLWRNSQGSPPGAFSTAKMWISLYPTPPTLPWTTTVWSKSRIPKHAFILWVALRNRLTTRDKLRSWGMTVPENCLLCGTGQESRNHIFFQCPYSLHVWGSFLHHRSLSPPIDFDDIAIWTQSASPIKKVRVICNLVYQAVVYIVWRERNSRLHSSISKPPEVLTKEIQVILKAKLFSMDRLVVTRSQQSSTNGGEEESYLYNWFKFFQR
ncbi:unnamed protein product [Microthlaspi erraticum]|uniref:Reverse transcriptase zinc-binding domain-containing protein n=1 Tax=Microthlaspi erraticum TaxID=1685480 RepID=A0A6D2KMV1_9BRAS|nr:unnamed protein product [Microthlaspi erraticum]